jgi:hypothetical protein
VSHNVIKDGYTRPGYIAAVDRLHDEVEFTYRPMFGGEGDELNNDKFHLQEPAKKAYDEAGGIASHLVTWSETDENGAAVPITRDAVYHLPALVRQKLLNSIAGYRPSDIKPGSPLTEGQDEEFKRFVEAQKSGKTLGQVAATADAKN